MQLADFDFKLPKDLIAQAPARPRDQARLLVYNRRDRRITDKHFYNLKNYLLPQTTLVLNDSKVDKSRLRFGAVEIFVLETINPTTIKAMVRPGKKFIPGKSLSIDLKKESLLVETLTIDGGGLRCLRLSLPIDDPALDPYRQTPLPPYIRQDEALSNDYQTVYARAAGSKAAPTAGLHFTSKLLADLTDQHPIAKLTLHVGLGTFAPVKTARLEDHKMHSEHFLISAEAAKILNAAASITAVGTTCLRVLESLSRPFNVKTGVTDIFITPGYQFKSADSLITNFHLPKSTLLMLVAAFIGSIEETHRIYGHAIAQKYRFYSFGDAMLII
jgi:S-adenosylmethionine:tRNA ribosyltransferase-isomerase